MTPDEVRALLAYASAIDPRIRRNDAGERQLQVAAWHAQLRNADPADARTAVDAHYTQQGAAAAMPGDIRSRCIASANDRAERAAPAAIEGPPLNPRPQFDLTAATAAIAARWAAPLATNPPRRRAEQMPRRPVNRYAETDADRARAGRAVTVCHSCVVEIPAPAGWNPDDRESPALYCERCTASNARDEPSRRTA